ncbi:MAG TPA: hypothetical protein GX529_05930 [Firmicutes bacterium]|nr:hypothetical protein [Candidatus Fermentithermobacillaceae bacterium]
MVIGPEVGPTQVPTNDAEVSPAEGARDRNKIREGIGDQILMQELSRLMGRVREGDLEARVDVMKFDGQAVEVAGIVNEVLETVTIQIRHILKCVLLMSDFDFTYKAGFSFKGLGGEIQSGLNALRGRLERVQDIANNIASGDLSDAEAIQQFGGGTGKLCENDQFSPTFLRMIQSLNAVLEDLLKLEQAIVMGQFDYKMDVSRHQGEYRNILESIDGSLEHMIRPINEALSVLERMAEKDLTAQMLGDYKGDHARLKDSLNAALISLNDVLSQVVDGADQVGTASNQVAASAAAVSENTVEEASALEEISASLEEISGMTRNNADNANEAQLLAKVQEDSIGKGQEAMRRMNKAIGDIKSSSDETAKIVQTIDEIAFQTNLLALNAAVEAARAGDAGRGFAVVAEEVRNLALRSAEAAKNTAEMIEESIHNSEQGVVIADEVTNSLRETIENMAKVSNLISEIAAASQEQAKGIEQVAAATAQMDKSVQQNAANAEESASAAEELSAQARYLTEMIEEFEVTRERSSANSEELAHLLSGLDIDALRQFIDLQNRNAFRSVPGEAAHAGNWSKRVPKPVETSTKRSRLIPLDDDEDFEGF